jgi:hypothetical protein
VTAGPVTLGGRQDHSQINTGPRACESIRYEIRAHFRPECKQCRVVVNRLDFAENPIRRFERTRDGMGLGIFLWLSPGFRVPDWALVWRVMPSHKDRIAEAKSRRKPEKRDSQKKDSPECEGVDAD